MSEEIPYKTYIGVKIVDARPMTLLEHNIDRGEVEFAHEDDDLHTPGYQVRYETGYISWSPKEPFEAANREAESGYMAFGMAVEAAKKGRLVARRPWLIEDFMFIGPHAQAMLSGPDCDGIQSPYLSLAMGDQVQLGWLPGHDDILSDDWIICQSLEVSADEYEGSISSREIAPVEASVRSDDHE